MTKRASGKFKRNPKDFYRTPESAVLPLLPHLRSLVWFEEPCAGDGALVDILVGAGHYCTYAGDIAPKRNDVLTFDALKQERTEAQYYITNPPWTRDTLHQLIEHLSGIAPTWLLFDADWMHTKQSIQYLRFCQKIVSVGRVSWMGNGVSGFDNCAWYLFDRAREMLPQTIFIGRAA